MNRRNFIRLMAGSAVLASTGGIAGCSGSMPPAAIEAWKGPGREKDVRRWILGFAILAPNSHNLQSWLVDLGTPDEMTLYCDRKRLLPETDPFNRQIMMSQGTFLELVDLAAREQGLSTDITLFPEGAFAADGVDARPVARIRLRREASVPKDPLFGRILRRHTNREPYDMKRPIPVDAVRAMEESVKSHEVRFGFIGMDAPEAMARHRAIAAEAWKIELTTPRAILESYKVLRVGPAEIGEHRDGLSITSPFVAMMVRFGFFDRTRAPKPDDFATTDQIRKFGKALDATPGFLWLATVGNDRVAQVNAGRAYARVQLAGAAQGLSMQPVSQALQEYPEQKVPHENIHRLLNVPLPGNKVQMWARVGYGPAVEPSPRRIVTDFLIHS